MKKPFYEGMMETILVTYVSISMSLYGIMKYAQFGFSHTPHSDQLVGDLNNMELMWAFYGRTLSFPLIIGFFEILGAGLLFFKRTRLLGCFLLSTILINIIIQDILYEVLLGALISAILYQCILLYLLWKNRKRLRAALELLRLSPETSTKKWLVHVALGVFVSTMIKLYFGL